MNEMTETMLTEVNMPQAAPAQQATRAKARKKISVSKLLPPTEKQVDAWIVVFSHIVLITQLVKNVDEDGENEWVMIEPFVIKDANLSILSPYLLEYTDSNRFVINSDKMLTLAKPNAVLQSKYESLLNG
jgi:hypothetical protein